MRVSCLILLVLAGCTSAPPALYIPPVTDSFTVQATYETQPGDTGRDPAIFLNGRGDGFFVTTQGQTGLSVLHLDGSAREMFSIGPVDHIKLHEGFMAHGRPHTLLVASNDADRNITVILHDPLQDKFLREDDHIIPLPITPDSICLGRVDGGFHLGVITRSGLFSQYELAHGEAGIVLTHIRDFPFGTRSGNCAFDDRTGALYITEDGGGLYVYPASAGFEPLQKVLARPGQFGLTPGLDGIVIYPQADQGGYLLVASRDNNSFTALSLPSHDFAGQFSIAGGAVSGMDVTSHATDRFPQGLFVVGNQVVDQRHSQQRTLKIVDWRDIQAGLGK